jgi:hypothetical protein
MKAEILARSEERAQKSRQEKGFASLRRAAKNYDSTSSAIPSPGSAVTCVVSEMIQAAESSETAQNRGQNPLRSLNGEA